MNSKERVKKAFHFDRPDKVPMSPSTLNSDFLPVITSPPKSWQPSKYPPHSKGNPANLGKYVYKKFIYSWNDNFRKKLNLKKNWWEEPYEAINEWEVIWRASGTNSEDKTFGHPTRGPFQDNWDGLNAYTTPDAADPKRYRLIKTKFWKYLGKKRYTVGSMSVNGFFNLCSQLRGFNNLLIDFAKNRNNIKALIAKLQTFYLTEIQNLKNYYPTLNSIMVADDLGSQKSPFFSPHTFQDFFMDPYKNIIALTHDLGMDFLLHSCGQIKEILSDIVNAGFDVLQFDSPHMTGIPNFNDYAERRKTAFWLSSNIQSTYVYGTTIEIEEEIKDYIKEVGNNEGGLAISEYGNKAAIQVPRENVLAQRKAVKKWGSYDQNGYISWLPRKK